VLATGVLHHLDDERAGRTPYHLRRVLRSRAVPHGPLGVEPGPRKVRSQPG
jgi:hypothetical protein